MYMSEESICLCWWDALLLLGQFRKDHLRQQRLDWMRLAPCRYTSDTILENRITSQSIYSSTATRPGFVGHVFWIKLYQCDSSIVVLYFRWVSKSCRTSMSRNLYCSTNQLSWHIHLILWINCISRFIGSYIVTYFQPHQTSLIGAKPS